MPVFQLLCILCNASSIKMTILEQKSSRHYWEAQKGFLFKVTLRGEVYQQPVHDFTSSSSSENDGVLLIHPQDFDIFTFLLLSCQLPKKISPWA